MYTLKFFESGIYVTDLGGPVSSLHEALSQIDKLTKGVERRNMPGMVGTSWDRNGTNCCVIVVDRFGYPIYDTDAEEQ